MRNVVMVSLLARALTRGLVGAHVGGALLLALVVAVEASEEPPLALLRTVHARLPELWASAATTLGMVGVGVAVRGLRRRGVLLGLGTIGVQPRIVLLLGALLAASTGVCSGQVALPQPQDLGGWVRGDGGWIRDGQAWPDAPGQVVHVQPPSARSTAVDTLSAGSAGACGAALGLWAGPAAGLLVASVLLLLDVLAQGLTERAALPPLFLGTGSAFALLVVLGLLVRSPIFPRRWT